MAAKAIIAAATISTHLITWRVKVSSRFQDHVKRARRRSAHGAQAWTSWARLLRQFGLEGWSGQSHGPPAEHRDAEGASPAGRAVGVALQSSGAAKGGWRRNGHRVRRSSERALARGPAPKDDTSNLNRFSHFLGKRHKQTRIRLRPRRFGMAKRKGHCPEDDRFVGSGGNRTQFSGAGWVFVNGPGNLTRRHDI